MARKSAIEQLEILKKGCSEIVSEEELLKKLGSGKPLRIKAGFDPTSPDIHLGHTVIMNKMKQFQDLGHDVIFIVGSFTAMIGDPSGADVIRKQLDEKTVQENAKTYAKQAFKILDKKKTEVAYNHKWLGKLSAQDIFHLTSHKTVARMLERDDFKKRFKEQTPIAIHEFLYPLFQAYDSYHIKADIELGGTDQKFNLLVGREIQRAYGQESQVIMMMPLLLGTDGIQKMSKSLGNYIGVQEDPKEIFGKLMSLSDEMMWCYYELLSELSKEDIASLKNAVTQEKKHPKAVKIDLAKEIVTRYYDLTTADKEEREFNRVFKEGVGLSEVPEKKLKLKVKEIALFSLLKDTDLAPSHSEARRLIEAGAVRINGEKVIDKNHHVPTQGAMLLQVGKRKFLKIIFS
ncbi:MAG: tyrosine--tRNA ligase [Deltaproteobacteria bacterium]|nr:tyrosine--tRNA ligase [Deltaproteobacteria bacterium]